MADYVTHRAGLAFAGAREASLRASLARAVEADPTLAMPPLEGEAFARLCESITVQESFFFREPAQLALLAKQLVDHARTDGVPIRVWSAGCAAGEEAYTIAALLDDAGLGGRYTVVGTDLSGAAVAAARTGTYGRWALRGLDAGAVSRYFARENERFRVRDHLRSAVEFLQHNLLEPLPPGAGVFEAICCRNLLIYLTPQGVTRAAGRLVSALAPGGWLVTGVADPLLDGIEGLETVVTEHGVAYRRAGAARRSREPASRPVSPPASVAVPGPAAVPPVDAGELVARADHALHKAQPQRAERLARRALAALPRSRDAHRLLVLALWQEGKQAESLQAAATAVAMFPTDGDIRHVQAVVLLESGAVAEARSAATRAVQLAPHLVSAHLLLARVHDLLGRHDEARSCRRHGRQLIAAEIGSA